jgi:hypothetical protein
MEDDERRGRPRSHRTDENVETVLTVVRSDRRLTITATAVQLNVDKETVKRPELWPNDCVLHYNNAPARKDLSVKKFLANKSIT